MKGNHNPNLALELNRMVVINMSKIQNERKSQQCSYKVILLSSCN